MSHAYAPHPTPQRAQIPTEQCWVCRYIGEVGREVVPHASKRWACRTVECAAGLIAGVRALVERERLL